jgi:hypothetical protein
VKGKTVAGLTNFLAFCSKVAALHQALVPVIPATWEADIKRITVGSQSGQAGFTRPYLENTQHKKRAGGVDQTTEYLPSKYEAKYKPQYCQKKKKHL